MHPEVPKPESPPPRYPQPAYRLRPPPKPQKVSALRLPARVVLAALGLILVVDLADIVLTLWATRRESAGAGGHDVVIQLADRMWLLQNVAWVATAAAFIAWLFLARRNLVVWKIYGLGWEPPWALFAWFIPLANLFIPPFIVNAVVRGSQLATGRTDSPAGAPALVCSWWITFVLGRVLGTFVQNTFPPGERPGLWARFNTTIGVLSVAAAVLAIILVQRITALQEARHAVVDS